MNNILTYLFLGISAYGVHGKKIKIECPSYCECDIFVHLKRATCVDKTIVVIQLDLPSLTQILDISHNQISQLDENAFQKNNLLQLKLLNISYNKLSQINIYAFHGLEELVSLDLSHNAIQYIFPNWFNSMKNLENLFLSGNNFGDMSNVQKYAFNSKSLKVLDLSKSYISYLSPNIFKLPNLKYMDLTENLLSSISPKIIFHLRNLKTLKITNNTFFCNKAMKALKILIEQRGIQYQDPCVRRSPTKFEKMILETTTVQRNFWIVDEVQQDMNKNSSPLKIPGDSFNKENSLICVSEFPYIVIIVSVLLYGLLIGFICGTGVKSCRMKHRIKYYKAKNSVRLKQMKTLDEETQQLSLDIDSIGKSTPIFTRRDND